jgi:hypothetical protein
MKMKFIIKDWAGNILDFKGSFKLPDFAVPMKFSDFESAWGHLYELFPEDDADFDDYFVEPL